MDADKADGEANREHRGSGHPHHLENGLYVGFYNVAPENNGMNSFTEKENVKIRCVVETDNQAEAISEEGPPSDLVLVIAVFEPQEIICTNATANRWTTEQRLNQTLVTATYSQSSFGGDPNKY